MNLLKLFKRKSDKPVDSSPEVPEDLKELRLKIDGINCTRKLTRENVFFSLSNVLDIEPSRLDMLSMVIVEKSYSSGVMIIFDDGGYISFDSNRWPDVRCNLTAEFNRAKQGHTNGVIILRFDQYSKGGPYYFMTWEQEGSFFIRLWFDLEKYACAAIMKRKQEEDKERCENL